ncbi:hypothetical protein [Amorphus sp. 3PC139-8]|uniref:hypothetical protein n=1 Tax=Amorphus sp. 3PC139-8 TaxID=2735676 RepID=UPI00345C79FB
MRHDVSNPDALETIDAHSSGAASIEAFAPPRAPMAMPVQVLEVSWSERLGLASLFAPLAARR